MNIRFEDIKINNFLSFGEAEVTLSNRDYTLVKGINENVDDLAKSNGAGKSTIFEAISWCLTGETIRGCKDVSNINTDDGALVELNFSIDNTSYKVIRSKNHSKYKTNLKVYINGEDKSGKGIRDTEKLLSNYIPDLTSSLLGSVIILGQGLPQRFTNNTPSGRKEVLEKLSKSDFMIEDLKNRITNRKIEINSSIKDIELKIANINGKISAKESEVISLNAKLEELQQPINFDEQIENLSKEVEEFSQKYEETSNLLEDLKSKETSLKVELENINANKMAELGKITEENSDRLKELASSQSSYETDIRHLRTEITKLENIKDVCPTCGQKLKGVEKPDTSELQTQLEELKQKLDSVVTENQELTQSINAQKDAITKKYIDTEEKSKTTLQELHSQISNASTNLSSINSLIKSKETLKADLLTQKSTREAKIEDYSLRLKEDEDEIENLNLGLTEENKTIENLREHLETINKFNTIITRDFRGFLLSNIIEFIDKKSKEYSQFVFETDKISFSQEGNNIEILYDGKNYDSLSGGEKQKIDLIIQFAIRDMLCRYLDFSSNIIALDEIFDNLDDIGCQKILNLISNKLNDVDSIFIITHHSDISIPADNEITIVKGVDKISRIK